MKLIDVGRKSECCGISPDYGKKDSKIYYETLRVNKDIPGLEDKEIGSVCRLEIEVKITGRSMREDGDGKYTDTTLDVMKVGYIGKGGKKTKEEYLGMNEKEREDYDRDQSENESEDIEEDSE